MQQKEIYIPIFWNFDDYYKFFLTIPKELKLSSEPIVVNDRNVGKCFVSDGKILGEMLEYYRTILRGGGRINVDINRHKIIEKWTRENQ